MFEESRSFQMHEESARILSDTDEKAEILEVNLNKIHRNESVFLMRRDSSEIQEPLIYLSQSTQTDPLPEC